MHLCIEGTSVLRASLNWMFEGRGVATLFLTERLATPLAAFDSVAMAETVPRNKAKNRSFAWSDGRRIFNINSRRDEEQRLTKTEDAEKFRDSPLWRNEFVIAAEEFVSSYREETIPLSVVTSLDRCVALAQNFCAQTR